MEKKKVFGNLKSGDKIYWLNGLDVKELKIIKINVNDYKRCLSITFTLDGTVNGYNYVTVGKYSSSSHSSTVFTEKKDAWEKLIKTSQDRYEELADSINILIAEFDKLEKFLEYVKGKTFW